MRLLPLVVGALSVAGCSLDTSGSAANGDPGADAAVEDGTSVEGAPDVTIDSGPADDTASTDTVLAESSAPDAVVADTVAADTFAADTFVPDTFMADTFVPDTFVPDTFVPDTSLPDTAPPCSEPNSGTYNGNCYFLVATASGWVGARDACIAASTTGHPAHLAVITTVGEWNFVKALPGGASYGRWIGLSAAGPSTTRSDFKWVNGEAFAYDAWLTGRPDMAGGCVVMHSPSFSVPSSWEDEACSTNYYSICERE